MTLSGRMVFTCRPSPIGRRRSGRAKGEEVREIVDRNLGWDITDFGQGDYRDLRIVHVHHPQRRRREA